MYSRIMHSNIAIRCLTLSDAVVLWRAFYQYLGVTSNLTHQTLHYGISDRDQCELDPQGPDKQVQAADLCIYVDPPTSCANQMALPAVAANEAVRARLDAALPLGSFG